MFGTKRASSKESRTALDDKHDDTINAPLVSVYDKSMPMIASPDTTQVHVIILVHGVYGNSAEMGYFQESLKNQICKLPQEPTSTNKSTTKFILHSSTANEGNTTDGVTTCGRRLAQEIDDIILKIQKELLALQQKQEDKTGAQEEPKITLSMIGNSLGGLLARFAISELNCMKCNIDKNNSRNNTGVQVLPNIFMTTATPHIGLSHGLAYVKGNSFLETVVAKFLKTSGMDLFNRTDILFRMSHDDKFTVPLQQFQKRVAYANAHGTDFQVPTNTAVFLSDTDSQHTLCYYNINSDSDDTNERDNGDTKTTKKSKLNKKKSKESSSPSLPSVLLTVETPKGEVNQTIAIKEEDASSENDYGTPRSSDNATSVTDQMAEQLDAMGWTKVLCDVRPCLISVPIISMPKDLKQMRKKKRKDGDAAATTPASAKSFTLQQLKKQQLQQRQQDNTKDDPVQDNEMPQSCASSTIKGVGEATIKSSDLRSIFGCSKIDENNKWHFPAGHTMLIANSKDSINSKLNSGGRPIVDRICQDFVQDVMS